MKGFPSSAGRVVALLGLVWAAAVRADEPTAAPPCPRKGYVVTVDTQSRELRLCQQGVAVASYRVAIGRGGVNKRRKGDGRTPVGRYTLGSPRPSPEFGLFIPINYPTPDQAAHGFTGSAVGIHGPPRGLAEPEYPTTDVDWTQGCIATGLDADIASIADFVRDRQPTLVIR